VAIWIALQRISAILERPQQHCADKRKCGAYSDDIQLHG
jgi:hypothetical protein